MSERSPGAALDTPAPTPRTIVQAPPPGGAWTSHVPTKISGVRSRVALRRAAALRAAKATRSALLQWVKEKAAAAARELD